MKRFFFGVLGILWFLPGMGALNLGPGPGPWEVVHPKIFKDPQGTTTLEEVLRHPEWFKPSAQETPSLGFSRDRLWIALDVVNPGEAGHFFLELAYTPVDRADLFLLDGRGTWRELARGTAQSFRHRDLNFRHLVYPFELQGGQATRLYLRIETSTSINLPLRFWTANSLAEGMTFDGLALGMFYGLMAVMFLYNLFLFLSVRDRNYVYYLLWLVGATLVNLALNGYSYQFFWPEAAWWNKASIPFFMAFGGFWGILFGRSFLETRGRIPWLDRTLLVLMGACLLSLVFSLVLDYAAAIRIVTVLWVIIPVAMLAVSVVSLASGFKPARFFLIAWFATFLGTMIFALKSLGVLPTNFITTWSMQIGIALEVILISLGLGDRINVLEAQRRQAQSLLISTKTSLLDSFARFVPTQFLLFLKKESIEKVGLGDAVKQEMTVLFSDIRNFTRISETMSVDDNFHFLNEYLQRMDPIIQNHGGFVDKFIGDAIMALFPGSPFQAVLAALAMREQLREINLQRVQNHQPSLEMGVGIHCGVLMLGTVGSAQRLETTVIGDSVNIASRLEGLTKIYRIPLIISEAVYNQLPPDIQEQTREIDMVRVKGKDQMVRIYEVYAADPEDLKRMKKHTEEPFLQALALYRSGDFDEALGLVEDLRQKIPGDPVLKLYQDRIQFLLAHPQGAWEGISEIHDPGHEDQVTNPGQET